MRRGMVGLAGAVWLLRSFITFGSGTETGGYQALDTLNEEFHDQFLAAGMVPISLIR